MIEIAITDWFLNLFNKNNTVPLADGDYENLEGEIFYKHLAIQSCINLIANTFSKSIFQTFEKGKEVRKENYYLFNVKPNQNLSSSEFWKKAINKLYKDNELLIIQPNNKLYIADSFNVKEYALKENVYSDIHFNNYTLSDELEESEVLHLNLNDSNAKNIIDGLYVEYAKLIKAGQISYVKNKNSKGVVTVDSGYPQTEQAQKDLNDLLNNRFKKFFNSGKDTVIGLSKGLTYEELGMNNKGKSVGEVRDVKHIDDIFDFVGIAFNVPPQLIKGNISDTENAINNFLMFCINPLAKMLTDEINMKLYSKEDYLERTYMKIDTSRLRVTTLKEIANGLDVLTRIGANTVNDNLKELGREDINEDYANERYMTKNYEKISKRGENNSGNTQN